VESEGNFRYYQMLNRRYEIQQARGSAFKIWYTHFRYDRCKMRTKHFRLISIPQRIEHFLLISFSHISQGRIWCYNWNLVGSNAKISKDGFSRGDKNGKNCVSIHAKSIRHTYMRRTNFKYVSADVFDKALISKLFVVVTLAPYLLQRKTGLMWILNCDGFDRSTPFFL